MEAIAIMVGAVTLLALGYLVRRAEQEGRDKELEYIVTERGGRLEPDQGVRDAFSQVWTNGLAGGLAQIYYHTTGGKNQVRSTRFYLRCRSGHFPRIEIYPQSPVHEIAKFFGMQDIEIGVPEFDDMFILKANDPGWLRSALTADVRSKIIRIHRKLPGAMYLHAAFSVFELRVDSWLEGNHLLAFHDLAMELAHALGRGWELPAAQPVLQLTMASLVNESATCLICGDTLVDKAIVRCRRCDTPHHADCWKYNGACAVYGCTEVRTR